MNNILIPASNPEDWKKFLADPEKQRKKGYSARTLAYCWHAVNSIPAEVLSVLKQSPELSRIEPLFIIPEHKVSLPGGAAASQNDIWVLGKTDTHLVSITVEGKVFEPLLEAKRFQTDRAGMIVHSFSPVNEWFEDYQTFIDLFRLNAGINELALTILPNGIVLYFAWIHGDEKYLEI